MKIKTLADILPKSSTEQTSAPNKEGKEGKEHKEPISTYFEDDPAYQDYLQERGQSSLQTTPYQKKINRKSITRSQRDENSLTFRGRIREGEYNKNINQQPTNKQPTNKLDKTTYANSKKATKKANRKANNSKRVNKQRFYKERNSKEQYKKVEPVATLDIKAILTENSSDSSPSNNPNKSKSNKSKPKIDNLTAKLAKALKTDEQRQAEIDEIKADGRLRWLAFYYLSTREHSAKELKDKLLAKGQDPDKIDALLAEFAEKGYQSDMRTAFMLIREGIRKGRGRRRIEQDFYKRKIAVPKNIDELIELANEQSEEFADFVDNRHGKEYATEHEKGQNKGEQVNWLQLAVQARVKKYGAKIPTDNKDKAKQLRFLQYRGFQSDICFEALRHDLQSVEDR